MPDQGRTTSRDQVVQSATGASQGQQVGDGQSTEYVNVYLVGKTEESRKERAVSTSAVYVHAATSALPSDVPDFLRPVLIVLAPHALERCEQLALEALRGAPKTRSFPNDLLLLCVSICHGPHPHRPRWGAIMAQPLHEPRYFFLGGFSMSAVRHLFVRPAFPCPRTATARH